MRRSAVALAVVVGVIACGSILLVAGGQQVPGTFRTEIAMVPLDVRVIDRDGRPVTDLTKNDFVVFENNVRQTIVHFSHDVLTAQAVEPGAKPAFRKAPSGDIAPPNQRIFLLVMGRGRLQLPSKGVDAAIKFVTTRLLPQDLVAVLAYNRATDFTTDHARITEVLENFKKRHERLEMQLSLILDRDGLRVGTGNGDPAKVLGELQPEIDAIFKTATSVGKTLPAGHTADPVTRDLQEATDAMAGRASHTIPVADPENGAPPVTDSFESYMASTETSPATVMDVLNVQAGVEYLRWLEGEKHIVFFTERGLYLPRLEDDQSLAAQASDARVVIHTVQTGGVGGGGALGPTLSTGPFEAPHGKDWINKAVPVTLPGPTIENKDMFAIMSIRNIAMLSGGLSSAWQRADKALARIDEVTRSEYLIGYYPTDTKWDERFRRVVVRVNRPGVQVIFRHGYYGSRAAEPVDRKGFVTYRRVAAAANNDREVADIKVKAKATIARNPAGVATDAIVDMSIDASRLAFATGPVSDQDTAADDGPVIRHAGELDISVYCLDARQRLVGEVWQTLEMKLKDETYQKVLKEGVPFTTKVPLQGEPRYVKAIVYDYESDIVGTVVLKLK